MSDIVTPQPPAEQSHEPTDSYVKGLMDDVFKSVGGDILEKPTEKEVTPPETDIPETPEPEVEEPKEEPKEEVKEEPKEEVKPEEDLDPEEKRQATWQKYKAGYKESERLRTTVIPELEKKVEEFEGTKAQLQSLQQQLEEARKDREALDHEIYKSRVQESKVFKEKVSQPFMHIEAAARQLAEDAQLDSGQFVDLLIKGDKKAFKEFTASLDEFDRADAHTMFKDMRLVTHFRDQLMQDSRSVAEREAQEARQAQETNFKQTIQARQSAVGEIIPGFTKNVLSLLPEDKRPDLNKLSEEVMSFDRWEPHLQMYGGYAAIVLPDVLESNKTLQGQLKEAQAELTKLRKGTPKASAGSPSSANGSKEPEKLSADTSYDSLAQSTVQRIRESMGLPN